jgi:hypothetical protein
VPITPFHFLTLHSHAHSKSHCAHSNSSQNRHLPPQPSISSLLNNRSSGRSSIRPNTRTSRSSRIRHSRHQPRSNKTRSLRQLAVNRRLGLNPGCKRHIRRQTDGFVGVVIAGHGVGAGGVEDFVDDVQDAVFDQDVGVDDAGGIDEDCAVGGDGDIEIGAIEGGEFGVVG